MIKNYSLFFAVLAIFSISPLTAQTLPATYNRIAVSPDARFALLWNESLTSPAKRKARSGVLALMDLRSGMLRERELPRPIQFIQWFDEGDRFAIKFDAFLSVVTSEFKVIDHMRLTPRQQMISWTPLSYLSEQNLEEFRDLQKNYLPKGRSPLASTRTAWHSNVGDTVTFETLRAPLLAYPPVSKWHYDEKSYWYLAGALGAYQFNHPCYANVGKHFRPLINYQTGALSGCFSHTKAISNGIRERSDAVPRTRNHAFQGKQILDAFANEKGLYFLLHEADGQQFVSSRLGNQGVEFQIGDANEAIRAEHSNRRSFKYLGYSGSEVPFGFLRSKPRASTVLIRFHGGPGANPLGDFPNRLDTQIMRENIDLLDVFGPGSIGSGEAAANALARDQSKFRSRLFSEIANWLAKRNYRKIIVYGQSFGGPYAAHFGSYINEYEPHIFLSAPALNFQANTLITGGAYETEGPLIGLSAQQNFERAMFGPNYANRTKFQKFSGDARRLVCELPNVRILYGGQDKRTPPLSFAECYEAKPEVIVFENEDHGSLYSSKDFVERLLSLIR